MSRFLSKVIFIQRQLCYVEIRQRLRSELLVWSFGKTFFMVYMVSFYWTDKSVTYFWGDVFFDDFEICVRLSWSARLVWQCSVCNELDHWMTNCKCCRLKSMQWCNCSIWALGNAYRRRPNSCLLGDGSGAQQQQHCASSDRLATSTIRMQPTFVMKMVLSMFSL